MLASHELPQARATLHLCQKTSVTLRSVCCWLHKLALVMLSESREFDITHLHAADQGAQQRWHGGGSGLLSDV